MQNVMPQFQPPDDHRGGLYDHEADRDLDLPRRRAIADWGADDLFHHTPRRRRPRTLATLERRPSGPESPRRDEQLSPALAATVTRIEDAPSYVADSPVPRPAAERALGAAPARPRRPPRTVEDRLADRPDRIAGWACALGLLLIFIAIVTAGT